LFRNPEASTRIAK
jgi:ribonuclease HI